MSTPVTRRTRFRSCALWSCKEQTVAEGKARPTTGCNGVDIKLGRLDRHTGSRGLVDHFVSAIKARYISRGTSDVQPENSQRRRKQSPMECIPNDRVFPVGIPARERVPYDPTGWPTQYALQAREVVQIQQATIAAHELYPRAPEASVLELCVEAAEESV